jgi:hypothetical protein
VKSCEEKRGTKAALQGLIGRISTLEIVMRTCIRLGVPALFIACAAFAIPASASLETDVDYYSALPQDQMALNEYTSTVACQPAEAHYVPSFIRAPDGTIMGVGYVEVESRSDTGC